MVTTCGTTGGDGNPGADAGAARRVLVHGMAFFTFVASVSGPSSGAVVVASTELYFDVMGTMQVSKAGKPANT